MSDEEKKRPEGMSQEEEARERWRNRLKHIDLAKIEDSIADAMTKLLNDPETFYVCSISKIEYEIAEGASFKVLLNSKRREKEGEKTDSGEET